MSNQVLRDEIIAVVDNQLKAGEPKATLDAYKALLELGYEELEAKMKIGAILVEEIYEAMTNNVSFNDARYAKEIAEMVQKCANFEDDTELNDEWVEFGRLKELCEVTKNQKNYPEMNKYFDEAFQIIKASSIQNLYDLDLLTDFKYDIEIWLLEYLRELNASGQSERALAVCQEIMDKFKDDDIDEFKSLYGETLYTLNRGIEGHDYFANWLMEDPENVTCLNIISWCIEYYEQNPKGAFEFLSSVLTHQEMNEENMILFYRIRKLAQINNDEDAINMYNEIIEKFEGIQLPKKKNMPKKSKKRWKKKK